MNPAPGGAAAQQGAVRLGIHAAVDGPPLSASRTHILLITMRIPAVTAAAAALLSLAAPAHAQDVVAAAPAPADSISGNSLQKGTWSLSFMLPGGGGSGAVGAWKMISPRTNLGVFAGLTVNRSESDVGTPLGEREVTDSRTLLDVGVQAKRYVIDRDEVAPFLFGSASIGTARETREDETTYDVRNRVAQGTLTAGAGVEWFPVRRVSVAGYTGLSVHAGLSDSEQGLSDGGDVTYDTTFLGAGTFTSGLTLQIYF
jgi:hypothetical protein